MLNVVNQRPIITLTTDFGSADGTVGAMIGVIKSICPDAEVVAVTSGVPAHDVVRGAWALLQTVPFFPPGTIHVAVVDPGVGSTRPPILADTGREILVGPDNGVLSWAWRTRPDTCCRVLTNEAYRLARTHVTFDGRDLFAPAAAHLARGADPTAFGPRIDQPLALDWPELVCAPGRIEGCVLVEDTFGNLITNIPFEDVAAEFSEDPVDIELDGQDAGALSGSYTGIPGTVGVVVNGTGLLEIASYRRSAAEVTGARRGARVVVKRRGERT